MMTDVFFLAKDTVITEDSKTNDSFDELNFLFAVVCRLVVKEWSMHGQQKNSSCYIYHTNVYGMYRWLGICSIRLTVFVQYIQKNSRTKSQKPKTKKWKNENRPTFGTGSVLQGGGSRNLTLTINTVPQHNMTIE